MCPSHNDAPEQYGDVRQLPPYYWKSRGTCNGIAGFYEMVFHLPGVEENIHPLETHLYHRSMSFVKHAEKLDCSDEDTPTVDGVHAVMSGMPGVSVVLNSPHRGMNIFKIGGQPTWAQEPEIHLCA